MVSRWAGDPRLALDLVIDDVVPVAGQLRPPRPDLGAVELDEPPVGAQATSVRLSYADDRGGALVLVVESRYGTTGDYYIQDFTRVRSIPTSVTIGLQIRWRPSDAEPWEWSDVIRTQFGRLLDLPAAPVRPPMPMLARIAITSVTSNTAATTVRVGWTWALPVGAQATSVRLSYADDRGGALVLVVERRYGTTSSYYIQDFTRVRSIPTSVTIGLQIRWRPSDAEPWEWSDVIRTLISPVEVPTHSAGEPVTTTSEARIDTPPQEVYLDRVHCYPTRAEALAHGHQVAQVPEVGYRLDPAAGRIRVDAACSWLAADFYARGGDVHMAHGHIPAVARRAAIRYIEQGRAGAGRHLVIPDCRLHPTGGVSLKSREQSFDFEAEVLTPQDGPTLTITGAST